MPAIDAREEFYGFRPRVPFAESFDGVLGLELINGELGDGERGRARVPVRDELLNAGGKLHGGVLAGIAEALASRGTALVVIPQGKMAQGLSNDTTTIRPVSAGTLHAEARPVSDTEDSWVWAVEVRDETGDVVGFSRVTIAVRPRAAI